MATLMSTLGALVAARLAALRGRVGTFDETLRAYNQAVGDARALRAEDCGDDTMSHARRLGILLAKTGADAGGGEPTPPAPGGRPAEPAGTALAVTWKRMASVAGGEQRPLGFSVEWEGHAAHFEMEYYARDLVEAHPALDDFRLYGVTGEIGASVTATFQMSRTQQFAPMLEQFRGLFTDPRPLSKDMTMMTFGGDYRAETHDLREAECARTTRSGSRLSHYMSPLPGADPTGRLLPAWARHVYLSLDDAAYGAFRQAWAAEALKRLRQAHGSVPADAYIKTT